MIKTKTKYINELYVKQFEITPYILYIINKLIKMDVIHGYVEEFRHMKIRKVYLFNYKDR